MTALQTLSLGILAVVSAAILLWAEERPVSRLTRRDPAYALEQRLQAIRRTGTLPVRARSLIQLWVLALAAAMGTLLLPVDGLLSLLVAGGCVVGAAVLPLLYRGDVPIWRAQAVDVAGSSSM